MQKYFALMAVIVLLVSFTIPARADSTAKAAGETQDSQAALKAAMQAEIDAQTKKMAEKKTAAKEQGEAGGQTEIEKFALDARKKLIKGQIDHELKKMEYEKKYIEMKYMYDQWNDRHWTSTFSWQFFSSIIIFIVVMGIIIFGMRLSYLHFKKGMEVKGELTVNRKGITVNSSVLGLLVLVLSLVFFYLYLTEVYPIKELSAHANAGNATRPEYSTAQQKDASAPKAAPVRK